MLSIAVALVSLLAQKTYAAPWAVRKPKLVVVISIDQFRGDYLSRFRTEFGKDGFNALVDNGAYFPYGEYDVLQSMTAPGHATILTGAYPYQMGIPINEWWDQKNGRIEYCVEDDQTKLVGVDKIKAGSSPRRLIGTTVGDELKNAGGTGRVVSLAIKDRAAILMGGHRADLAFWYDRDNQRWTTSTYYREVLPPWLSQLNSNPKSTDCKLTEGCSADITVEAFKAALVGEKLGQHSGPDLLAVGFSGHDMAGHRFGPNSEEMHQMTLKEDRSIAEMRRLVKANVPGGLRDVVWVLTGDHGVAPTAEYLEPTGIETGHIDEADLARQMDKKLTARFKAAAFGKSWIAHTLDFNFFVEDRNIVAAKAKRLEVERVLKEVLVADGRFAQVVTQSEFEDRLYPPGMFTSKVERTYYPGRSGLVIGIQKPFFILKHKEPANHMTGYTYDRTVPVLFAGAGIRNMVSGERVGVVDIAPTLSYLLGILPPALSEGKVLMDAIKR